MEERFKAALLVAVMAVVGAIVIRGAYLAEPPRAPVAERMDEWSWAEAEEKDRRELHNAVRLLAMQHEDVGWFLISNPDIVDLTFMFMPIGI